MSRLITFIFILELFCFSPILAEAGWQGLALPQKAEKMQEQTMRLRGEEIKFSTYRASFSPEEIVSFYRRELSLKGWQEEKKDLNLPLVNVPGTEEGIRPELLFFNKGEATLKIMISRVKGQTLFTLIEGKKPEPVSLEKGIGGQPQKLDFMPLYPQAKEISLFNLPQGKVAVYVSADDTDKVISFYKLRMPGYGWSLKEESSPQEEAYDLNDLNQKMQEVLADCPNCPKELPQDLPYQLPQQVQVQKVKAHLSFMNRQNDECKIEVEQTGYTQLTEKMMAPPEQTTITVKYYHAYKK